MEAVEGYLVVQQPGLLAAGLEHLGVPPAHPARQAGADRLEGRLLGREAGGQVGQRVLVGAAVGQLAGGEDALFHALAEALEGLDQALDPDDVHSDAPDRHLASTVREGESYCLDARRGKRPGGPSEPLKPLSRKADTFAEPRLLEGGRAMPPWPGREF